MLVWSEAEPPLRHDLRPGRGACRLRRSRNFHELGLDLVPGTGLLAAAVPGAFDGWMRLLRDYGTMPLARGPGAGDLAMPRTATRWPAASA